MLKGRIKKKATTVPSVLDTRKHPSDARGMAIGSSIWSGSCRTIVFLDCGDIPNIRYDVASGQRLQRPLHCAARVYDCIEGCVHIAQIVAVCRRLGALILLRPSVLWMRGGASLDPIKAPWHSTCQQNGQLACVCESCKPTSNKILLCLLILLLTEACTLTVTVKDTFMYKWDQKREWL